MPERRGTVDPSKFPDELFNLYSIPAFDSGVPEVVKGQQIGSTKQIVQPGDVLLSKIVPHIRRAWVVGESSGQRLIASSEWILFGGDHACPQYLRHILVSDHFHSQFMRTVAGVGGSLLRARPTQVARIEIPLPPLPEQRRIAAILDKADGLRAKRRAALAQLNGLTQAMFLETFGDPISNSKGWEMRALVDAVESPYGIKAGPFGSSLKKEEYTKSGYRIYGQEQVLAGRFDVGDYYISERKFQSLKTCAVREGDVLVSLVGSFGKVLVVPAGIEPGIINPRLLKISPRRGLLTSEFLASLLAQPSVQTAFERLSHGGTMGILNAGLMKQFRVPLPPEAAQSEFSKAKAAVAVVQRRHIKSMELSDTLFATLQHQAFAGAL